MLHSEFNKETNNIEFLKSHRDFIELNQLGFGDRAFHFMWLLILDHMKDRSEQLHFLEIGVYKGQVVSLWALISKMLNLSVQIHAISPFKGNLKTSKNKFIEKIQRLNPIFRSNRKVGNNYEDEDYLSCMWSIFSEFNLTTDIVKIHKGYSTEESIYNSFSADSFDIIYIDGDHSYKGCLFDIEMYAPKIKRGGFLIMDDASWFIPGDKFWKGYESVSKACEVIPEMGFENVLNIGHNRLFKKI